MNTNVLQRGTAVALFVVALAAFLFSRAVPALLAGLLAFTLTHSARSWLGRYAWVERFIGQKALSATLVCAVALVVLGGSVGGLAFALTGESVSALMLKVADTLHEIRRYLPATLAANVPEGVLGLREWGVAALQHHAAELAGAGKLVAHSLVLSVVGWLVGVLIAVRPLVTGSLPEFSVTWSRLWGALAAAFRAVATAQFKIALLNALLTAVFLLGVLPMWGWHVPYAKTLVLATFVCGLLPVVGNLISNTLITLMALSVHFHAAVVALGFLIVAHKLEYFVAARIQGDALGAQVWELLVVLFVAERFFGPAGMVFAPVLYSFIKTGLRQQNWLQSDSKPQT